MGSDLRPRELGEVHEEVLHHGGEVFHRRAARQLWIGRAEQLLRELEHAREVGLGESEDRQDHLQRILHRDVASEVAPTAELHHSLRRQPGELSQSTLELGHVLRKEPLRRQASIDPMIGVVHVDQGAQQVALLDPVLVGLEGADDRPRRVLPLLVVEFDLQHVGMLGDHVERSEAGVFDQVDRVVAAQHGARSVEQLGIGVGRRCHEHLPRRVRCHRCHRCASEFDQGNLGLVGDGNRTTSRRTDPCRSAARVAAVGVETDAVQNTAVSAGRPNVSRPRMSAWVGERIMC